MRKKWLGLVLAASMLAALLSGCDASGGQPPQPEREKVTIALWSDQLTEHYTGYLQETFPEVDFTFYVATNSTDFYRFKEEHGDLPDILTVRRFALRDVAAWKDALLDLSDTGLVDSFSQTYLRSYTYDDGTVNWLPTCAEVDGIAVNKALLEDNGLALPTNYQEFVDLCAALREKGIRPFRSNFDADYTCMELLQGLSVAQLSSQAGREWRRQYEAGQTNQLSEEVWLPAFERLEEFIDYAQIGSDQLSGSMNQIYDLYRDGDAAMIRGTPSEIRQYAQADDTAFLPFFGATAADNWYLTYPAFQVAAKAVEDEARKELILDIMAAMLNEEGLRNIAGEQDVIPYNRTVGLTLSPLLENMRPYIYSNRLYIRLASSDMFELSRVVVQGMLDGTYPTAQSAFDAFNGLMAQDKPEPQRDIHVAVGYSYAFDAETGNQAASAVMNSLREEVGTDLLLGPATAVAGNILDGDYSIDELRFLTMGETPAIAVCQMTGEQIEQYLSYVLNASGKRGSVVNDSTLYVSS
ncbi:MAG: ABC transporter substrate-binding protein, partial [Muribaculaceae bacterium]|nr:ABC transporter substrate-binding protein [Muribaculaceae bacterium]